jgi:hypothetical protein
LANLPGRWALAVREHQFGKSFPAALAAGVLADLAWLGPVFALVLVGASALASRANPRRAWLAGASSIVLVSASMWLVSVGATEFLLQRGAYPSLGEALEGLGDPTFVRGSIGILLFERYSTPTIAVAALTAVLLVARERTRPASVSWGPLVAYASLAAVAAVLLFGMRASFEPSVPPLVRFVTGVFESPSKRANGIRGVLESTRFDEAEIRRGLASYGFDPNAAPKLAAPRTTPCERSPIARPLPDSDHETELVRALLDLSASLFQGTEELVVWHVVLESFRADDVHALHRQAPPTITPFTNAMYDPPTPDFTAIGFPHTYQAGVRTAQAMSAIVCGLGALPFQLALSRDLSDLPLRCAPDVLRDAGFATRLFYGSDATFENLGRFAAAHGMDVIDQKKLPPDLPRGAWRAVTDDALMTESFRASENGPPLQYNLVLTLSGHSPFDLPEDAPPSLVARADELVNGRTVQAEDRRRLVTMAYADHALHELFDKVYASGRADHSILLVSADHATADTLLWGGGSDARAGAAVPMFLYVPSAMLAAAGTSAKWAALRRLAARTPVSLDDVPTMLLALLARHGSMQRLADDRRWHTMGGASTSTWATPISSSSTVWGIDASSHVFTVGGTTPFPVLTTEERSIPFSVWNEPLGPVLRDATAALSAILTSARTCTAP